MTSQEGPDGASQEIPGWAFKVTFIIFVVPLLIVFFTLLRSCNEASIRQERATAKRAAAAGEARLYEEIAKLQTSPCTTQLEFADLPILGWQLTCAGCAGLNATDVFPRAVLDEVERYAVRGRFPVKQFYQLSGQCP